ncbi:helix-turn-helix transcriptional regulator [Bacillus sp. 37MA]|uniref:helix-turn-helix domain-containing protein n=1 Tax=Bacillus sp. 37MA TaxID=1132442 RepID=UPI0003665133|nr:helix-turn-helix transcriptional regulator [Bacillus sp. 37MA]
MNTLGERLKALRLSQDTKKSQKEFGKLFDLSESTIGMYERNERKPDYEILQKFAEHFSVSIDYLITGKESINVNTDISSGEKEMMEFFKDPNLNLFFKEMKEAPEEQLEEMRQIWEVIKKRGLNK